MRDRNREKPCTWRKPSFWPASFRSRPRRSQMTTRVEDVRGVRAGLARPPPGPDDRLHACMPSDSGRNSGPLSHHSAWSRSIGQRANAPAAMKKCFGRVHPDEMADSAAEAVVPDKPTVTVRDSQHPVNAAFHMAPWPPHLRPESDLDHRPAYWPLRGDAGSARASEGPVRSIAPCGAVRRRIRRRDGGRDRLRTTGRRPRTRVRIARALAAAGAGYGAVRCS